MVLFPRRQRLAAANIAACFPELSAAEVRRIREGSVRNICRTMAELFKLPTITPAELLALTDTSDAAALLACVRDGRGVVAITAHFGNWEWMGAVSSALMPELAIPITVVARDAPHGVTAGLINQARQSHRMEVLGTDDLRSMLGVLRRGGILGILPDQHAVASGVKVDFFDRPAWTFSGPAVLAGRTGAAVVPTFCPRLPDGTFKLLVLPEVVMVDTGDRDRDTEENTRRINAAIETAIRMYPDQWLWMHNRWKDRRVLPSEAEIYD